MYFTFLSYAIFIPKKCFHHLQKYRNWQRQVQKFKKSYDLPLDLLQYRRENSAEYLYS